MTNHLATASPAATATSVKPVQTGVQSSGDEDGNSCSGVPRPKLGGGRGKTHPRSRLGGSSRSSHGGRSKTDAVTTEDDDPEYEENRKSRELRDCRKINILPFSPSDKDQDFVIWIDQFQEAVKQQTNPHSQKRHWKQCLKWLPLSLKPDAYAIWSRSAYNRSNWPSLRTDLEESFEDREVRTNWHADMKAFQWDERMSLRDYRAKVERLVDTFDKEMASMPAIKKIQYYTRFVNGLPEDYREFLGLNLPSKCADIEKALEASERYQSTKKRRQEKSGKSEIGASANFGDPTVSARVAQNENELKRMQEEIRKMKKPKEVTYADEEKSNFNNYSGRSPGFQRRGRYNPSRSGGYYSDRSKGSYNSDRGESYNSDRSGTGKSDRSGTYNSDRSGAGKSDRSGTYNSDRSSGNNGKNYPRTRSQERMRNFIAKKKESLGQGEGKVERTNPKRNEESLAFTDLETEEEDPCNDTLALYEQYREEEEASKWDNFCALKHSGN